MNVKKMVKTAAIAAILGTGFVPSAYADVSVEDVKCTQRYPWNGLVDIEYTIACDDPEAEIYVNPVGFNGDTGLTVFPTHFTGDGATNTVKAGKHTMVWDAKADLGNTFATKNFQIKMYAGKKLSRYIVIDISGGTNATSYAVRHSIEGPNLADDTCRTTEIWMRLIPPGTFMMGSPEDELGRSDNEDLHKVTITKPYYMGVFEVTQRQWELVKGGNPSYRKGNTRPVENINFNEMYNSGLNQNNYGVQSAHESVSKDSFMGLIRSKTRQQGFDLPTEAQWEHSCRAGTQASLYSGEYLMGTNGCANLNRLGCNFSNADKTAKVGTYQPNGYGLYDMYGNTREWCKDGYVAHLGHTNTEDVCSGKIVVSSGYSSSTYGMVARGGSFASPSRECRSAARFCWKFLYGGTSSVRNFADLYKDKEVGFRLCCTANLQQ